MVELIRAHHAKTTHEGAVRNRTLLIVFLAVYFLALCFLSMKVPLEKDFFPDEKWRIALPMYFYEHGAFPTGYEESTRMVPWGFSYASYPLLLSTVIGGFLMKFMGLLTSNMNWIVFAGRLVSIVSGTALAYFVTRISVLLFRKPVSYLFAALVIFLPQIIFCSLYFNNDIVALCGSSMVLYAWLLGLKNKWNIRNGLLLSAGIIVIALSYYNAYSWILLSIVVYCVTWYRDCGTCKTLIRNREFRRLTLMMIGVVLVAIAPFFIRAAILNHGDFLGLSTVSSMSERYGTPDFKPSGRPTPQHLGMSLWDMLTTNHYLGGDNNWLLFTYRSFVGVFGPMNVFLPRIIYMVFGVLFMVGMIGCIAGTIFDAVRGRYGNRKYFDAVMLLNILIVVALALQYSYATDYQAQGRYILPMVLSFTYFVVRGWGYAIDAAVSTVENKYLTCGVLCGFSGCVALLAFAVYYLSAVA